MDDMDDGAGGVAGPDGVETGLIEVILVDSADGDVLGRTLVPAATLPANFDGTQMLELGDEKFLVRRGEPDNRDEYRITGTLTLQLSPVKAGPPGDVDRWRFSMSSICDELPPRDGPLDGESALNIRDDLWRDVELVGPGQDAAIETNFAAIAHIQDELREGPGFTRIHIRTEPAEPLADVRMSFAELAEAFGTTEHFLRPVAIPGEGVVRHGYALSITPGVHLYGVAVDDRLTMAGIHRTSPADGAVAEALAAVLRRHGCELVDWRGRERIGADPEVLAEWFGSAPQELWR